MDAWRDVAPALKMSLSGEGGGGGGSEWVGLPTLLTFLKKQVLSILHTRGRSIVIHDLPLTSKHEKRKKKEKTKRS